MTKNTKTTPKRRWADGAVIYQIYPRSFYDANGDGIGDLAGIIAKLDYLKELQIDAIWLSPFYPSPMADFGYDISDYRGVDPIFGDFGDMQRLIKEAHQRDIRIMVDLVPNHTSDEHEWFQQSRQSKDNPYADWYIWRDAKRHDRRGKPIPPNNWINLFSGGSAWQWDSRRQQFYMHTFDVRQPDLDWTNPAVRKAIKDVMRFWLDQGVDGFRVDAIHFMAKDPELRDEKPTPGYVASRDWAYIALQHTQNHGWPPLFDYLGEMADVLKESAYRKRQPFMVTEAYPDNSESPTKEYLEFFESMDPEVGAPFIFAGLGLPWQAKAWRQFLKRFHTALDDFSPHALSSYAFGNHDQDRIVTRVGRPTARSMAVLLLSLPGMAFIYNGEELGMSNGQIPPEYIQDPGAVSGGGRDPERTPFQWSTAKNAGFSKAKETWLPVAKEYAKHNVEVELGEEDSFLNLYKRLTNLRHDNTALRYGDITVFNTGRDYVLGYLRRDGDKTCAVFINFAKRSLDVSSTHASGRLILSSRHATKQPADVHGLLVLRPHEAVIIEKS